MRKLFKIRLPWCRATHVVAATIIILAPAAAPAHAQVLYGSIVGNITDAQGAALPGATITATNNQTNQTRDVAASSDGTYSLPNLQPGQYNLTIQMPSFREFVRTNVPVTAGEISRVDASLQVGGVTEAVTVESPSQLLQTDKADVHTELKSAEITALPLNQYRNYQALVNLVPGASPAQFQNAETDTPQRSLRTNVNGQNPNTNSTRTDGATNVNLWLPHHNMYVSPAETVDTVNISTNNFDAEQGMAGGAAVTVITKSGTNSLRGSAFEFYNGDSLNATPYYFGTGEKPDKLPVKRNIFGGTVGGPIVHDKLFFFGSFEAYKENKDVFQFFDVPNAQLRAGDFSQAFNSNGSLQPIYDPATGDGNGVGRTPFPGNVIPQDRIDPIAQQLLGLYPLPNSGGTGAGGLTNDYRRDEKRTFDRYNYDAKINWNRTAAHQIWG
ncbi:MAG TPA: carboxypeptidase-like regulatory domain-containing protein, partial [Vicinamibacterales bacterium]